MSATSIQAMAGILVQGLNALGLRARIFVWQGMSGLNVYPAHADSAAIRSLAGSALRKTVSEACKAVLLPDPDSGDARAVVPLLASSYAGLAPGQGRLLALANSRLAELLHIEWLRHSIKSLEHSERLQKTLFAIADMAGSDLDMDSLLKGLHECIAGLMYAENFFIALHDEQREVLRFIYFTDVMDGQLYGPDQEYSTRQMRNTLTMRIILQGSPMRGPAGQIARSLGLKESSIVGTPSVDFMAVPMRRDGRVYGILVVQSYEAGRGYTESDQNVLSFVAGHVLDALERKRSQEAMEQQVQQRTRELAEANARLQQQLLELERGAHLQATLYRIAALSHDQGDADTFYQSIHKAVAELLNADNFFIALVSDDASTLHFPYCVDKAGDIYHTRPMSKGMTEYTIRLGRTVLRHSEEIIAMISAGELDAEVYGSLSVCWLGAPLLGSSGVMGVVVVQSYDPAVIYTEKDADLLTFVSYQIASTLQRRQNEEALKLLNSQLERRVQERTRELRQQIMVREQMQKQLRHQVMHDALTGLPNRLHLRESLGRALKQQQRQPEQGFALLYLDIDHFKGINDRHGHLLGDAVLRQVSRRLLESVRKSDMVSRLSGDEFLILLKDCRSPELACMVAQKILDRMQEMMPLETDDLKVTVSIGIAMSSLVYSTVDEVMHAADTALYRAKSSGRARFELFSPGMQA